MVSPYIIFILFLFWLVHVTQRMLYGVYFWQLKEYRFDRIKGDAKRSLKTFFPKTALASIFILVILPFFLISKSIYSWEVLVLVIFCLFGLHSTYLLLKGKWKLPKFTKKAVFLLFLSAVLLIFCLAVYINSFFLFIVVSEIVLAVAIFLITEILQIPTFFIKVAIYKKAKNKIERLKGLTVIGITGSYGKSSTKEFLYTILSEKYKVLKTSGNTNTEIGVAQTVINKLSQEHQIFIVEMGAYRKGEISLLCDIVKPKIGIVTGVNEQHLALFGSFKNLLSAEGGGELAAALPENGLLIVNGDNKYCLNLYKRFDGNKKVYSTSNKKINSDIWSDSATVHKNYISFLTTNRGGELAHFDAKVLGKQNIQNLLGAILAARELGMSFEEIESACKKIKHDPKTTPAGMVLRQGKHGIDIVDSSYSANPDGVFADLDYFSIFQSKKIIVMPSLIELGGKSSEIHEKIGRKIGEICDMAIITSKDRFKEIKKGFDESKEEQMSDILRRSDTNVAKCLLCDNPQNIYSMITLFCKSGDAVLLEGRVPAGLVKLLTNE